jgi:hypothetical protein
MPVINKKNNFDKKFDSTARIQSQTINDIMDEEDKKAWEKILNENQYDKDITIRATGHDLDRMGEVLGIGRQISTDELLNLSDEEYRRKILTALKIPEELCQ